MTKLMIFHMDMLGLKKKNFYGLINTFGKETIPCEFYSIYYDDHYTFLESFPDQYIDRRLRKKFVYEDYILVCKIEEHNGAYKWGYYNKNGNLIIPFKYDNALPFTESLAPVMKNGKWGFIDKKGKVVISFIYQKVANFDGDKAKVTKKNLFGKEQTFYIDQQGNRID